MLSVSEERKITELLNKKDEECSSIDTEAMLDLFSKHFKVEKTQRGITFDIEVVTTEESLLRKLYKKYQKVVSIQRSK